MQIICKHLKSCATFNGNSMMNVFCFSSFFHIPFYLQTFEGLQNKNRWITKTERKKNLHTNKQTHTVGKQDLLSIRTCWHNELILVQCLFIFNLNLRFCCEILCSNVSLSERNKNGNNHFRNQWCFFPEYCATNAAFVVDAI